MGSALSDRVTNKRKLWYGGAALLMLCASVAPLRAEQVPGGPFLPPQATVVLIAGLPGDVESETVYREQLQAWMEIAVDHSAQRIIILCDAPESIQPPGKTETKALQADRNNFQKLPALLTGQTNAVIVIAWGHGGRQGSAPVFHVRGPR